MSFKSIVAAAAVYAATLSGVSAYGPDDLVRIDFLQENPECKDLSINYVIDAPGQSVLNCITEPEDLPYSVHLARYVPTNAMEFANNLGSNQHMTIGAVQQGKTLIDATVKGTGVFGWNSVSREPAYYTVVPMYPVNYLEHLIGSYGLYETFNWNRTNPRVKADAAARWMMDGLVALAHLSFTESKYGMRTYDIDAENLRITLPINQQFNQRSEGFLDFMVGGHMRLVDLHYLSPLYGAEAVADATHRMVDLVLHLVYRKHEIEPFADESTCTLKPGFHQLISFACVDNLRRQQAQATNIKPLHPLQALNNYFGFNFTVEEFLATDFERSIPVLPDTLPATYPELEKAAPSRHIQ